MTKLKLGTLFSGIGCWEIGLQQWCQPVFACEKVSRLHRDFHANYGVTPVGDIYTLAALPALDVLAMSPPCQSFSKAGKGLGTADPRGQPIYKVFELLDAMPVLPEYLLMENVAGLQNYDVYSEIVNKFEALGYNMLMKIISPVHVGIPQNRERLFLICSLSKFPQLPGLTDIAPDLKSWSLSPGSPIEAQTGHILDCWNDVVNEFGAEKNMDGCRYALDRFGYIRDYVGPSRCILDWKGKASRPFYESIITLRQSGVRVAEPKTHPCLTATGAQTIVGWHRTYLADCDWRRLMSVPPHIQISVDFHHSLGNAINCDVVRFIGENLF